MLLKKAPQNSCFWIPGQVKVVWGALGSTLGGSGGALGEFWEALFLDPGQVKVVWDALGSTLGGSGGALGERVWQGGPVRQGGLGCSGEHFGRVWRSFGRVLGSSIYIKTPDQPPLRPLCYSGLPKGSPEIRPWGWVVGALPPHPRTVDLKVSEMSAFRPPQGCASGSLGNNINITAAGAVDQEFLYI